MDNLPAGVFSVLTKNTEGNQRLCKISTFSQSEIIMWVFSQKNYRIPCKAGVLRNKSRDIAPQRDVMCDITQQNNILIL